jgi:hypothetical protein
LRTQSQFDQEFTNMNMAWASPFSFESTSPLSSDIGPFEQVPTRETDDTQNDDCPYFKISPIQTSPEFMTPPMIPSHEESSSKSEDEGNDMKPDAPAQTMTTDTLENVQDLAEDLRQREQAARDRFWETLTLDEDLASPDHSMTFLDALDLSPSQSRPRKLHKKMSLMSAHRIFSTLSESSLHVPNKLRKKLRPSSTPTLLPRTFPSIDLPNGIEQLGHGIGYKYNLLSASRSGVSVSTPHACRRLFSGNLPIGLGLGIGKTKRHPKVIQESDDEDGDVIEITSDPYGHPCGLGLGMSGPHITSPLAFTPATTTEITNSPESEVLATPDAIEFTETREAKTDDPNVTLRLVSSGLQLDAIRRDLGLAPSDIPAILPFRHARSRSNTFSSLQ